MPSLADDVVGRVRREIERTVVRARNGIRYVAGQEWAPISPSPRDAVWRQGPATLWHYRGGDVRHEPPVLLFIGLVSRSWILDLHPDVSLVAALRDAGFDVYVLDWGEPGPQDATNTLETYTSRYLPRALSAVLRTAGSRDASIVGYCMGGNLALLALAAHEHLPVRNLVTLATAVDLSKLPGLAGALGRRGLDPGELIDWTGNVPAQYVGAFFRLRKPTSDIPAYASLWENLWNDQYVGAHQAMARWAGAHVAFPGAAFRQVHDQWLGDNGFLTDRLRLGGRSVHLQSVRCPTLAVLAGRDDLVVPETARPIDGLLGADDFELLELDAGHAGLGASRTATSKTFPAIIDWLERHSEPRKASA